MGEPTRGESWNLRLEQPDILRFFVATFLAMTSYRNRRDTACRVPTYSVLILDTSYLILTKDPFCRSDIFPFFSSRHSNFFSFVIPAKAGILFSDTSKLRSRIKSGMTRKKMTRR